MKKFLLIATALLSLSATRAEEPQIVFDVGENADPYIAKISEISRVAFVPGSLRLHSLNGEALRDFDHTELRKVLFDYHGNIKPTGIELTAADPAGLRVFPSPAEDFVALSGFGENASVEVFSTSGKSVIRLKNYAGGRIDVSSLPAGVYIVKSNSKSAKFFKK